MNTHSKKWNVQQNPNQLNDYEGALDIHYFFALPNPMDNNDIIQVIQGNTTSYNLQDLEEEEITKWKKAKAKGARMRCIRKRTEVLVKLKRELRLMHKRSRTESGILGICWWNQGYWDESLGIKRLKVKKEEPSTPPLHIKVQSPPTPNLQYPASPTTPSSHYRSLGPNDFENWGDLENP